MDHATVYLSLDRLCYSSRVPWEVQLGGGHCLRSAAHGSVVHEVIGQGHDLLSHSVLMPEGDDGLSRKGVRVRTVAMREHFNEGDENVHFRGEMGGSEGGPHPQEGRFSYDPPLEKEH